MITEAIILAGGLGTRLRSAVPELPKVMAPVLAKPFIGYLLDYFTSQGITRFIFSLGYKHEVIKQYLDTQYSHLDIELSIEEAPRGTGGGIRLAADKARSGDVLVLNGDSFFRIDVKKLSAFHTMCGADCTLSLKPMNHFDRYGVVELNRDYSVKAFREKQFYEQGLINGGAYALHVKRFLNEAFPAAFSFEKEYLEKLAGQRRFYGVVQDEYFIDIGIPEDFERAQTELIQFI
jgi:D-glycero-alpha-D-manno-heptose 1-phosphate guanylyltransferase